MTFIPVRQGKRGPAPTGQVPVSSIRLSLELRAALDAYVDQQPEPRPSRSEMIRMILQDRLVHEGLIKSDAEMDANIADQKALIADMPSFEGPSPEAGMARMDKAVAENDLIDMKNERTTRRRRT